MSKDYYRKKLGAANISLKESIDSEIGINEENNIDNNSNVYNISLSTLESAPVKWNFYSPLNDNKMEELLNSIVNNGLLVPIIVWEQVDNPTNPKYMILSGHNRVKAYEILKEVTKSNKYDKINAIVKRKEEISEDEAREIIIDTNWVQRQLSTLEKSKSIYEKYAVIENLNKHRSNYNEHGQGRTRDVIAKQFDISGIQVERYRKLNYLINDMKEMISDGLLALRPEIGRAHV